MNILITLMLVAAAVLFAVAFAWILSPRKKDTFNIHIDKGTAVSVSQSDDGGIRLDFNYESYETRPSDDELFPNIVNTAGPTTPLTRGFWQQVAVIDELQPDEKESLCDILLKYGIINEEQMKAILYGDDEGFRPEEDTEAPSEAEPEDAEEEGAEEEDAVDEPVPVREENNTDAYYIVDDDDFENASLID